MTPKIQIFYLHIFIDPIGKDGHVPIHARSIGSSTASSPAGISNQPPHRAFVSY